MSMPPPESFAPPPPPPPFQAQPMMGNGPIGATPFDTTTTTDQTAIIAQQLILLSTQAVLVRFLEDQLTISPPGPVIPVPPPPGGANLQALVDNQTAAIRTQAAYTKHLQDVLAAL